MSFSEQRLDTSFSRNPLECAVSESCNKAPSMDSCKKSSASSRMLSVDPQESPRRKEVVRTEFRDLGQPHAHSGRKSGSDPSTEFGFTS